MYRYGRALLVIAVGGHTAFLSCVIVLRLSGGFSQFEMTVLFAIVVPVLLGLIARSISIAIAARKSNIDTLHSDGVLNVILASLLCITYFALLIGVVICKAFNIGIQDFEDLVTIVSALEAVFAATVAYLVN